MKPTIIALVILLASTAISMAQMPDITLPSGEFNRQLQEMQREQQQQRQLDQIERNQERIIEQQEDRNPAGGGDRCSGAFC
jgi:hypothetical protein